MNLKVLKTENEYNKVSIRLMENFYALPNS